MNETQYLLICLSEECAEVSQRVSKALRFGLHEVQPPTPSLPQGHTMSNLERLEQEFNDLLAVGEALGLRISPKEIKAKKEKIAKYMDYSREQGTLE